MLTLSKGSIEAAARALDNSERTGVQTGLLSAKHPDMTIEDAYAIQTAWISKKLGAGGSIIGHKIGLTSKAMQSALNIDVPDSGTLFADMLFADGEKISKNHFIQPRVEAELAFILKSPLNGKNLTIFDVLDATNYISPALEILDTRIYRSDPETQKFRTIVDTISDNAANAGVVLGGHPIRPNETDLRWIGAIVSRNAQVEETGLSGGVLNHPARGIVWLANRLASYGKHLEAGQIILSGSFIRPLEARNGDTIIADFGPYGTVSIYFE